MHVSEIFISNISHPGKIQVSHTLPNTDMTHDHGIASVLYESGECVPHRGVTQINPSNIFPPQNTTSG